jgi:hypothetical protein
MCRNSAGSLAALMYLRFDPPPSLCLQSAGGQFCPLLFLLSTSICPVAVCFSPFNSLTLCPYLPAQLQRGPLPGAESMSTITVVQRGRVYREVPLYLNRQPVVVHSRQQSKGSRLISFTLESRISYHVSCGSVRPHIQTSRRSENPTYCAFDGMLSSYLIGAHIDSTGYAISRPHLARKCRRP